MKLSKRTRYGFRLMTELARHFDEGPIALGEIARREDLSEKYLEQIVLHLKTAGFVTAVRGPKGGYSLSVPPSKIKLKSLFDAFEGSSGIVECVKDASVCNSARYCASRRLWLKLERGISETLNSLTLADLLTADPKEAGSLGSVFAVGHLPSGRIIDKKFSF